MAQLERRKNPLARHTIDQSSQTVEISDSNLRLFEVTVT
jgi:hypothetical protein